MLRKTFALLLFLAACNGAPTWTPFNDPANVHHSERVREIDVLDYKIRLTLDPKSDETAGSVEIRLRALRDVSAVVLDAEDMTVTTSAPFTHEGRALTIRKPLRAGELDVLTISFRGKPTRGLFFVRPDDGYPDKPAMIWSQGETEYNHFWFPCWDDPGDRATSEMIVTAPAQYAAISNGRLVSRTEKDGWATTHWRQDVDHPAYLVSLVVAELDTYVDHWGKVPVEYHVAKGRYAETDVRRCLGATPDMIEFFSSKIGTPYPYDKYAQILVWDFIWGGMENISATTLHQWSVYPERVKDDTSSEGLVAHELAHQWFGDLLTCRSWAHIWLNEGFATYFAWLWTEHRYGADRFAADRMGGAGGYFGEDQRYRRPTVCSVYTDAMDLFDSHSYPRGAWVLHMLRDLLGDEKWWKGIALYVRKHAREVVVTENLRDAMEEASGEDLDWFFDQWLYRSGFPEFEISKSGGTLTVTQTQKPDRNTPEVFRVPVSIRVGDKIHRVWIDERRETFTFDDASLVVFDCTGSLLKKVTWNRTPEEWLAQLRAPEGIARVWAAEQVRSADALFEAARKDPFVEVRKAAARGLGRLKAWPRLLQLLGDKPEVPVRRAILETLHDFVDQEAVRRTLHDSMWGEETPGNQSAAAIGLGKAKQFDDLLAFWDLHQDDPYLAPATLEGLARTEDARALPLLRESVTYGRHPWVRRTALRMLAEKKDVDALLPLIEDPAFPIRSTAIERLGEVGDARAIPLLEVRFRREFDERIKKSISASIRKIRERGPVSVVDETWTPFDDEKNRHQPERKPVDVVHYRLELTIDPEARIVAGKTHITFEGGAVEFDAADMKVTAVTVDGSAVAFRQENGRISFATSPGRKTATIEHSGSPTKGLKFLPGMVWSQGQSEDNHYWFPCYDSPNDRATSETIVTAPAKYQVISNGKLLGRVEKDGWATTHHRMEQDHVSYLISIIVGDFDSYKDRAGCEYHVPKGQYVEEDVRRDLGMAPDALEWFGKKTGVPYPYPKYAQTLVWEGGGGMENVSATTLYEWAVYPKRVSAELTDEALVVHELAHQWFGDLVTCRTWAHLWLNEGFATYAEWLWAEHKYGATEMQSQMHGWASGYGIEGYLAETLSHVRPIVCDVYTEPDDLFDSHTYDRGGWILHMLRVELGDELWWKGVSRYVKKHANGLVTTADFHQAMEEGTGRDLDAFFDQWVFGMGHPEFEVSHRYENGQLVLVVEQKQKPRRVKAGPLESRVPEAFRVSCEIEIDGTVHRVLIDERREEFTFRVPRPRLVSFDRTGAILKTLVWQKSQEELAYQLRHDPQAVGRRWAAGRLRSVEALAGSASDPCIEVTREAARSLAFVATDEAVAALLKLRSHAHPLVRRTVLDELAAFAAREDVAKALRDALANDASIRNRAVASQSLAKAGPSTFAEIAAFFEKNLSDRYASPDALKALAVADEDRAVPIAVDSVDEAKDPWLRRAAVDVIGARLGSKWDDGLYEKLMTLIDDPASAVRNAAIGHLAFVGDERALPKLEARLLKESQPWIRKALEATIERIRSRKP